MRLLLDTHTLLWALVEPERLPKAFAPLIRSRANSVHYSAASIWEIAIKSSLKPDQFALSPDAVAQAADATGFNALPITVAHAAAVHELTNIHRDPFDRILVAQAQCEAMLLLTSDTLLAQYGNMVRAT